MERDVEVFFSADVETDGPIPGPYSILSFAIVYAGRTESGTFHRPQNYKQAFYRELKPISNEYEEEALRINKLDRERLKIHGDDPEKAMTDAWEWVHRNSDGFTPILVAYPLSFDWTWLYWYFTRFCAKGSPFGYSQCFDIKTAVSVKLGRSITNSSRSKLPIGLASTRAHTHHAIDDAIEQADIFANVIEWIGK